jgi:cysteine desulfurase
MLNYLDNNATTRPAPEVVKAMLLYLEQEYANPSSPYTFARRSALAMEEARREVASLAGVAPKDLVFTSGGTESNNTAIHAARALRPDRRTLAISAVEHVSVLAPAEALSLHGARVQRIGVTRAGRLDEEAFEAALTPDTFLISVMAANNETGVLFPIEDLARRAREKNILFHCDATQALGKIPLNLSDLPVDFASFSAHKLHGPKGSGALYIHPRLAVDPYIKGGGQEDGRRAGTENVAAAAGFGVAASLAREGLSAYGTDVKRLRDDFERSVKERIAGIHIVGEDVDRLPNTSLLLLEGVESEPLLALLDMEDICCSSGSACQAGAPEPSHVLKAMGWPERKFGALRVSLSRYTTHTELKTVADKLEHLVKRLRSKNV